MTGRARHTSFLEGASLADARERVTRLVQSSAAGLPPRLELLTEQLIKYAKDDAFFNLHWDIDAETVAEPLPSGNPSELGPGCVIAALNLKADATVMLHPRYASIVDVLAPGAVAPGAVAPGAAPGAPTPASSAQASPTPAAVAPAAAAAAPALHGACRNPVTNEPAGSLVPAQNKVPAPTPPAARTPAPARKVKVDLKHGDLYLISGAARWEWLHGVSLHPDDALGERRAVVWRFKSVV